MANQTVEPNRETTPTPSSPPVTVVWQPRQESMAPGSSRLVARERKKLVRQTLLLFFLLIGFGLVFLFFIFPNAPRLITFFIPEKNNGSDDTIPPQPPVLYAVPAATNSAVFQLQGYSEPQSSVSLLLNAVEVATPIASDDGSFATELTFQDGENVLTAVAQDAAGNSSKESKQYMVQFDTQTPGIELTPELLAGLTVVGKENKQYELSGKTEPLAKVLLVDRFVFADAEGIFRFPFDLNDGENKVTITATDKAGNSSSLEVVIMYKQ